MKKPSNKALHWTGIPLALHPRQLLGKKSVESPTSFARWLQRRKNAQQQTKSQPA
jgi:hypothetical protein